MGQLERSDQMEQTILSAISSLGFPIVCCLIVLYMYWKSDQTHKAEVDKLSEAVQNNTVVMEKILERLEVKKDEFEKND
jgi:hypothetical protein